MLNEYRDMRARLVTLTSELASLTATARSSDGVVTATVDPHGDMVDLQIDEQEVRRAGIAPLVPSILEAAGRASTAVRAKTRTALKEFLPDWMHDVVRPDGRVDIANLLPAEPSEPSARPWRGR